VRVALLRWKLRSLLSVELSSLGVNTQEASLALRARQRISSLSVRGPPYVPWVEGAWVTRESGKVSARRGSNVCPSLGPEG